MLGKNDQFHFHSFGHRERTRIRFSREFIEQSVGDSLFLFYLNISYIIVGEKDNELKAPCKYVQEQKHNTVQITINGRWHLY